MKTYTKNLIPRARAMRREMTKAERRFWFECLRGSSFKFRTQRPFGKFIVDFYCAELKLIIEIDGDIHFNNAAEIYDLERAAFLETPWFASFTI
jgi:very-short-patch-repair endonuclease